MVSTEAICHNAAVNGGVLIYNREEPELFPVRNGAESSIYMHFIMRREPR